MHRVHPWVSSGDGFHEAAIQWETAEAAGVRYPGEPRAAQRSRRGSGALEERACLGFNGQASIMMLGGLRIARQLVGEVPDRDELVPIGSRGVVGEDRLRRLEREFQHLDQERELVFTRLRSRVAMVLHDLVHRPVLLIDESAPRQRDTSAFL